MDHESLNFVATQVSAIFAFLTFLYLWRSRRRRIAIYSRLSQIDNKTVATIRATNLGQPPLVIERLALSLVAWDNTPRLAVPKSLKLFRFLEPLIDYESAIQYVSDAAIVKSTSTMLTPVTEHCSVAADIDLDGFIEAFVARGDRFGSRLEFAFLMLGLKAVVVTPVKKYSTFSNYEIRYYLWRKYRDDPRLFIHSKL